MVTCHGSEINTKVDLDLEPQSFGMGSDRVESRTVMEADVHSTSVGSFFQVTMHLFTGCLMETVPGMASGLVAVRGVQRWFLGCMACRQGQQCG